MGHSIRQTERWIKEGRGQGHGSAYRPWLSVQQVLSCGHAHKILGLKTGRLHHVLSDLEAACLTVLEFDQDVVDIREQYPLLPSESTHQAALRLGLRHPMQRGTTVPCVLSSDFCVDVRSDRCRAHETAIAVKYTADLSDRRTRERLAIEREANLMADRQWSLFTEQTIPTTVLHNLKWLRRRTVPAESVDTECVRAFCRCIHDANRPDKTLETLLQEACSRLELKGTTGLTLLAVAAWYQYLYIRLDTQISERRPLRLAEGPLDLRLLWLI